MRLPQSARRKARIEIVPLIDIMFFLLATFVMVSLSMVKNEGIAVHLPVAQTGGAEDRQNTVTISISAAGDMFLNQELVDEEMLASRLSDMKQAEPDLRVFLNGDEDAPFGTVIGALDKVRLEGITKIAVQTRSPSAQQ